MKKFGFIGKFFNLRSKHIEYVLWEMKTERLMNLCRDTGGEESPYFYKLTEHLKRNPNNESA